MKEAIQKKSVEVFSVCLFLADRQNQPRRMVAFLGFSSLVPDFVCFFAHCDPSRWGDSQYILIVRAAQRRQLAILHDCGDSQKIAGYKTFRLEGVLGADPDFRGFLHIHRLWIFQRHEGRE